MHMKKTCYDDLMICTCNFPQHPLVEYVCCTGYRICLFCTCFIGTLDYFDVEYVCSSTSVISVFLGILTILSVLRIYATMYIPRVFLEEDLM